MSTRTIRPPDQSAGASAPYRGGGGVAQRPSRAHALPEFHTYIDTGCAVAPSCLNCPLPSCRYDRPGGAQAVRTASHHRFVLYARHRGITVHVIALYLHLSLRRAYALIREARTSDSLTLQLGFGSLDPLPSTIRRKSPKVP